MFNPLNLLSKIIKSGNQKELDRIGKIVNRINSLEKKFENIDNSDFPKKTSELISRLNDGEMINQILPEAFALVREASKRVHNERHFDVQLIGGAHRDRDLILDNRFNGLNILMYSN